MAYVRQTFVASQILTAAQVNQIETNIADHVHGQSGVAGAGMSIRRTAKTAAFTVQASDIGSLFDCTGAPYTVDFDSAATLGTAFAAQIKNSAQSNAIYLDANGTQTIDGRSGYLLAPQESVLIYSDGSNLGVFGEHDPVTLLSLTLPNSWAQYDVTVSGFADHFTEYDFMLTGWTVGAALQVRLRISVDSGATYMTAGYDNSALGAATTYIAFMNAGTSTGETGWLGARYNRSTSAIRPVFNTYNGKGVSALSDSQNTNFASTNSGYVVHGLRLYTSASYVIGGQFVLRGYGRR